MPLLVFVYLFSLRVRDRGENDLLVPQHQDWRQERQSGGKQGGLREF